MSFFKIAKRFVCTAIQQQKPYLAECLVNRDVIKVQGKESVEFLQGLITNDMNHLVQGAKSMYTMFLNDAGRVLYDCIIYKGKQTDSYIIECDNNISYDLRKHLRNFRVRKQIDIESIGPEYNVWTVFNEEASEIENCNDEPIKDKRDILCIQDPRLKNLGLRIIQPKSNDIDELLTLLLGNDIPISPTSHENSYKWHRYRLGVGEGSEDLPPTKCFALEANCDYLHGISFNKGCYLGQELTARVYHTGVVRKRIMPLVLSDPSEIIDTSEQSPTTIDLPDGKNCGVIRGIESNIILGLIRLNQAFKADNLIVGGKYANLILPDWWPKTATKLGVTPAKQTEE